MIDLSLAFVCMEKMYPIRLSYMFVHFCVSILHEACIEMNLLCEDGTRCGFILVFIIITQDLLFKSKNNIKFISLFILFVCGYANVNPTLFWGSQTVYFFFWSIAVSIYS